MEKGRGKRYCKREAINEMSKIKHLSLEEEKRHYDNNVVAFLFDNTEKTLLFHQSVFF